jgi:putative component of membrane protein insertase Oxa1/YidC/SpoIIIJ protein YidD
VPKLLKPRKSWKGLSHKLPVLLISLLIIGETVAPAVADQLRSPWPVKTAANQKKDYSPSTLGSAFDFYVKLFQRYISPVDGRRCQLYPTCSQYARLCLQKHGGFLGFIMSADRLMRDNWGVSRYYPPILYRGHFYYYDPVEANDFWF